MKVLTVGRRRHVVELLLDVLDILLDRRHYLVDALQLSGLLVYADRAHVAATFVHGDAVDGHSLLLGDIAQLIHF